ncbi:hypothetical protein [Janibacter cremeus]|uniref:Uncharacterized protein n=1 Tax=Janibacter cremeus TaxID=1285192 RepID=A0A852VN86_9MICO|nr:hypothetical protein [Janibacter cremeus]NYF98472.1 hypothetical protein [Janibacter cremeus]
MKKIWMTAIDALRPTSETKRAPRHAAAYDHDHEQVRHNAHDHRMSDRLRPTLSTR